MLKTVGFVALATFCATIARADVRLPDQERLANNADTYAEALASAVSAASQSELRLLEQIVNPPEIELSNVEGNWNCRTAKLGGRFLEIVIYQDFRCRITKVDDGTYNLEKLTGSQRTSGQFSKIEGGKWLYLGVGYVDGGPAVSYDELPTDTNTPVDPGSTHSVVGYFEMTGENTARLMQPSPQYESQYDILYLTR
ncbi:DUF4893 domain-containing protein [Marivivens donghaensis]|uniref:DUF4893 domain-containing protein n=1 Tax=Marivivens donghaensis TaxID=1699413 RepID=A0ABX0VUY0_9RHOB|nr:DUF4893 domain-containing protein [Marivivens donghaensis]NIY71887.1 DUF4893 domain-containing protein [Marivivens donghaensis]